MIERARWVFHRTTTFLAGVCAEGTRTPWPATNAENPMESAEMIERLRRESGFRLLPLLDSTGTVTGLHLTRFLPGGYLEVVQAYNDRWAVFARVRNVVNTEALFDGPELTKKAIGSLAEIAMPLLPLAVTPRHLLVEDARTDPVPAD